VLVNHRVKLGLAFVSGVLNAGYFLLPPPGGKPEESIRTVSRRRHDEAAS
jgi:hypothetical protein